MSWKLSLVTVCALGVLGFATRVDAAPIIAPVSGVINAGGPGWGTLTETFDQSGLFSTYTPGVTDFDAFLSTNPLHTSIFDGNEWFSESGTTASVTYDLGAAYFITRLALWNEESSGIGLLNLSYSLNGVDFFSLAQNLVPTDNPAIGFDDFGANPTPPYGADVFSFASTQARYLRLDMSGCGLQNDDYRACALGEVAVEGVVPEPGTLLLFGGGLVMAGAHVRRRRNRA